MNIVSCSVDKHTWVCREESGSFNEIKVLHNLKPEGLNKIKSDPGQEKTICPEGSIICSTCGEHLNKTSSPKFEITEIINFRE